MRKNKSMIMCSINWLDPAIIAAFVSGGFAAVSGIVTLCVYNRKKKIEAKFKEDLSDYQANLERTTNELQERLRVEYGSLYQKRIDSIELLYNKLLEIRLFEERLNPNSLHFVYLDEERFDEVYASEVIQLHKMIKSLSENYLKSRIYFSLDDDVLIMKLLNSYSSIDSRLDEHYEFSDNEEVAKYMTNKGRQIIYSKENIDTIIVIENRFRELIGVTQDKVGK